MLLTDLTVETVLTQWPETADLFRRHKMTDCFGCQIALFCTVAEAIALYRVPEATFIAELQQLMDGAEPENKSR